MTSFVMVITINNQQFTLKNTFRSHIIYESITGKAFAPTGLTDILTFFYATLMASNPDATLAFDNFIDYVDAEPDTLTTFINWLAEAQKVNSKLTAANTDAEPTTKAKKKK